MYPTLESYTFTLVFDAVHYRPTQRTTVPMYPIILVYFPTADELLIGIDGEPYTFKGDEEFGQAQKLLAETIQHYNDQANLDTVRE